MLGIFFSAKSAVLIEDVPFTEEDIRNEWVSNCRKSHYGRMKYSTHLSVLCPPVLNSKNPPQNIYNLYNQVGINCFIAAAVYVAVGAVSLCQVRLNKRQEYMVT